MKNITRDQHYVQREYLSLWTNNLTSTGIALFEVDGKESKAINIQRILFQKDFYEIPILSNEEMNACKEIVMLFPYISKNVVFDYFENLSFIKKRYEIGNKKEKNKIKKELIQLGEDFQKCGENMMKSKIKKQILECDSSFLKDNAFKQCFLNYIFMQYLRTPKIRKYISNNSKNAFGVNIDGKKIWSTIHGILASTAANYLTMQNIQIKFLVSKNENFITCDCPVVRLPLATNLTDRFYYPFSPRIAMIIGCDEGNETQILDDKTVEFYNSLIRSNAERIIVFKYKRDNSFDNLK